MLPPPHMDIDALPYIDQQYTPAMQKQVESLIEAELKTFKPAKDYLAQWPMHEPDFEVHARLSARPRTRPVGTEAPNGPPLAPHRGRRTRCCKPSG
jgi:hypothetical protein